MKKDKDIMLYLIAFAECCWKLPIRDHLPDKEDHLLYNLIVNNASSKSIVTVLIMDRNYVQ